MNRSSLFLLIGLSLLANSACDPPVPPSSQVPLHGAGEAADWCAGHGLPESMCTLCNPGLTEGFKAAGDWCGEHGFPESVCPQCNPATPPEGVGAFAPGTRIRFRSPGVEATAGIETARAADGDLSVGLEATATITFDSNRVAEVRAAASGVVRELKANLGDLVSTGTALFVIESGEVGDLRARLGAATERSRTAEANLVRQRELREAGVASPRQEEIALQEVEAAGSDVHGATAALHAAGADSGGATGRFRVTSPLAGTVVRRPAMLGSAVSGADLLAIVADTSVMWALLDVRESDVGQVRLGQPVSVRVDGVADLVFRGSIEWISAEVDPRTRRVAARAVLDNPDGLLRAHQFGRAVIQVEPPEQVVTVPRAAVQRLEDGSVVFVRTGPGVYEPRAVDPGRATGGVVQVRGPLEPGEEVVTTGAFLLKTELRRDALGAGCCEIEAPGE